MLNAGLPPPLVDYIMEVHAAHKSGELAGVRKTVLSSSADPRSFRQFASDLTFGSLPTISTSVRISETSSQHGRRQRSPVQEHQA
jgi:hypothetical protein